MGLEKRKLRIMAQVPSFKCVLFNLRDYKIFIVSFNTGLGQTKGNQLPCKKYIVIIIFIYLFSNCLVWKNNLKDNMKRF